MRAPNWRMGRGLTRTASRTLTRFRSPVRGPRALPLWRSLIQLTAPIGTTGSVLPREGMANRRSGHVACPSAASSLSAIGTRSGSGRRRCC